MHDNPALRNPTSDKPIFENQILDKPIEEKPALGKHTQLNKDEQNIETPNTIDRYVNNPYDELIGEKSVYKEVRFMKRRCVICALC